MHILMISLGSQTNHAGHDQVYEVLDAARSLTELGFEVSIWMDSKILPVAGDAPGVDQAVDGRRLHFYTIPTLRVISASRACRMPLAVVLQANLAAVVEVIGRRQEAEHCDLIHCFGWQAGLAGGLLSRLLERPLVASARDLILDRSPWLPDDLEAYSRAVWWWLLPQCEAIVCPDEYQKEKFMDLFMIWDRDVTVLPPVPSSTSSTFAAAAPTPHTEWRILYHGSLRLTPGLRGLLEACARLCHRPSASLQLFLSGPAVRPDQPALGSLIRRLSLAEQIVFLEPRAETGWWSALLASMDLLVLPDPIFFLGNLIHMSVAVGCPVLFAESGPVASWLRDGDLAEAIWQKEPGQWERSLERTLFDDNLREKLWAAERCLVKELRPMGESLAELYRDICHKGGAEARRGGERDAVRVPQH
jgi:glycosyltransferase involved in cell wall biosynthesis